MACNSYKTLQIDFNEPDVAPKNGYVVKWRAVGATTWNQVANQFGNPLYVSNVPVCQNIEGTIQADCGSGNFGTAINFAVTALVGDCYTFTLLEDASYSYIPCASSQEATIQNLASAPSQICALDNSVSGGHFTRLGICYNQ